MSEWHPSCSSIAGLCDIAVRHPFLRVDFRRPSDAVDEDEIDDALCAGRMAIATPARAADFWLTPFVGSVFGGDTDERHAAFGLSAAWMGTA